MTENLQVFPTTQQDDSDDSFHRVAQAKLEESVRHRKLKAGQFNKRLNWAASGIILLIVAIVAYFSVFGNNQIPKPPTEDEPL